MAESMKGLHRSHRCTEVSEKNIGETVTVMGWAAKKRNLGSLIFVDLRDRSGILQIVFDENDCGAEAFAKAETIKSEYVIAVVGKIDKRGGAITDVQAVLRHSSPVTSQIYTESIEEELRLQNPPESLLDGAF